MGRRGHSIHSWTSQLTAASEGYRDSSADIAFTLRKQAGIKVLTPSESPDPGEHTGWSFPDTESGILSALRRGATHLWANTILFAEHPLQVSAAVGGWEGRVWVVGQAPRVVEAGDDKAFVNDLLRGEGGFTMPRSWMFGVGDGGWRERLAGLGLPYPVVGKPVRGRGSYGVRKCEARAELEEHVEGLFGEGWGGDGGGISWWGRGDCYCYASLPFLLVAVVILGRGAGEEGEKGVLGPPDCNALQPHQWNSPLQRRRRRVSQLASCYEAGIRAGSEL